MVINYLKSYKLLQSYKVIENFARIYIFALQKAAEWKRINVGSGGATGVYGGNTPTF